MQNNCLAGIILLLSRKFAVLVLECLWKSCFCMKLQIYSYKNGRIFETKNIYYTEIHFWITSLSHHEKEITLRNTGAVRFVNNDFFFWNMWTFLGKTSFTGKNNTVVQWCIFFHVLFSRIVLSPLLHALEMVMA